MKRLKLIFGHAVFPILLLSAVLTVTAQADTFDIVQYSLPKGWTKTPKDGAVVLSDLNKTTNGFCIVTISAARASTGNPQKDFDAKWFELAVTQFKAEPNPKPEAQTEDGWTSTSGASPVEIDGVKSFALLTVFSGYGKTSSIFSIVNDQSYLTQLDALLGSIKLDKTKPITGENKGSPNSIAALPAVSASGAPGKFGHMLYKAMPGWKQTNYTNAVSFAPSILSPEFAIELRVMEAKPFSGNVSEAFAASWEEALQQLEAVSEGKPTSVAFSDSPPEAKIAFQGWEYVNGNGYVTDKNNNSFYLDLFVIKVNNRLERMFVVAQQIKQMYGVMRSLNQYTEYNNVYNDFFYSVKFDDWTDKGAGSGSMNGAGIVGLYAGLKMKVDLADPRSGDVGGLTGQFAAFFSNGQVYYRDKLPLQGFEGFNTQSEAMLHPGQFWGTYTLQNGHGEFKTSYYGVIPLEVNATGIALVTNKTAHNYIKLPSIDGATFSGTYAFPDGDWGGKPTPSITFTLDGRFEDNGAMNILHHNTTERDALNTAAKPGSGTYVAKNYTLIFNYSDGRRVQIAFGGLMYDKKNVSPATLTLSSNNDVLTRR